MGEVAAVTQVHAHDPVARLQEGEVGGHVGLGARVGLHVGVVGAEKLDSAGTRQVLDPVRELAAAVVAPSRQSFGILVREDRPHGLPDRRRREVLARDHLELAELPGFLVEHRLVNDRVGLLEVFHSRLLRP